MSKTALLLTGEEYAYDPESKCMRAVNVDNRPPGKPVHWQIYENRRDQSEPFSHGPTQGKYQSAYYARQEAERRFPHVPLNHFSFTPISDDHYSGSKLNLVLKPKPKPQSQRRRRRR